MRISSIVCDEGVVGSSVYPLTGLTVEEKLLQVVDEDVLGDILDAGNIPTHILTDPWAVVLPGRMGHHLTPSCSSLGVSRLLVVVAFDPEDKEALPSNHGVIDLGVFIKFLQISDIPSDVAAATNTDDVDEVAEDDDESCCNS